MRHPSTGSGAPLFTLLLASLLLCSCVPKQKGPTRLKVIASMPVVYDWTRNLMNENENTTLFLNLIIKNGMSYHSCVPGITEENLINSAGLLIYVGGPSEKWIDEYVEKSREAYPQRIVVRLIDYFYNEDGSTPDEHFILSPEHAQVCCQKISEALCLLDGENASLYKQASTKYLELLSILDNSWKLQSQRLTDQSIIICDHMPFKYLFNEYGINYLCIYDECPVQKNASPDSNTLVQLGHKIDELGLTEVYVFESSDKKLAEQVISYSKNPKCDTLVFDCMESLTLSQLFSGKNYIDIMRNNLTLLRPN